MSAKVIQDFDVQPDPHQNHQPNAQNLSTNITIRQ